jgi:hypothetical protein
MKKLITGILGLLLSASFSQAGQFGQFAKEHNGFGSPKRDLLSPHAQSPFSYNFLEAGWARTDLGRGISFDGYQLGGSFSPIDHVFIWANGGQGSTRGFDLNSFSGGVGAYVPITDKLHWVTTAGFGRMALDGNGVDELNGSGFVGHTGLRWSIAERFEAQAGVGAEYIESDYETAFTGALLVGITENIKFIARGSYNEDVTQYGAGLRMEFR